MAQKKKATKKSKTAKRRPAGSRAKRAAGGGELLRGTWAQTVRALSQAEAEVEQQIRGLIERNRITRGDARQALRQIGARIDTERKRALKDFEGRLKKLQSQLRKERRSFDRRVDDAVEGALARFNIPSRREVTDLTRKVNHLSRQIEGLPKARRSRKGARR